MKKNDLTVLLALAAVAAAFVLSEDLLPLYNRLNSEHGMVMSFVKFALLATFGEALALRIRSGQYNQPGFGLLPRAIVWGLLGITIKMAFVIFATGVPVFLQYLGMKDATELIAQDFSAGKLFVAFCISLGMNTIYAPVMMTLHKVTDTHILAQGGSLRALMKPVPVKHILQTMDWQRMWGFVFMKTIPFFWIPAHTITFLLPQNMQVLFAALLGVALGVLLSLRKA